MINWSALIINAGIVVSVNQNDQEVNINKSKSPLFLFSTIWEEKATVTLATLVKKLPQNIILIASRVTNLYD